VKKRLMIIGMIAFLIIANCITIFAATENTVTLHADSTNIKAGETFKVTVKVATPEGINGLILKYSYDTEKLELVSHKILDTNFINLGGSANEINLMCSPADISNFTPSTESDIYEFSFKVKDGVAVDSTAKVALDEVHLSTCSELESEHDLEKQELTITVVENQEGEGDGEGESGDPTPCEHTYEWKNDKTHHWKECTKCNAKESGSQAEHKYEKYTNNGNGTHSSTCTVCNYKLTENHNNKDGKCEDCDAKLSNTNNNTNTNSNNKNTNKNDNSTANKDIPKAGLNTLLGTGLLMVVIVAIVMYVKNKKYQDII